MSSAYTNPEGRDARGVRILRVTAKRFGCEANAKSSPQSCHLAGFLLAERPLLKLRTHAYVKELLYDRQGKER